MNARVFTHSLRTGRAGLAWYLIATTLILLSGTLGYDAVQNQQQALQDLMKSLPPAFLQVFQITDLSSPVSYVVGRALSLMWPILVVAFAAGSAGGIAALVERGTIHYELSLPLPRTRWLASRVLAGFTGFILILAFTTIVLYATTNAAWWRFTIAGFAFGVLWLGVAYAVAAFGRERGAVTGVVFGLFGLEFLMTTFARVLPDSLGWMQDFSLWTAYQPENIVRDGLNWAAIALWVAVGAAGLALAAWRWRTRDLPA